ncbi:MAG: PAS domain-containing sensor histidine kinase [Agriterribacter sp.]
MADTLPISALDAESRQALFATVVEFSEDAILTKTLDGTITSWNQAAERLFGYNESEILHQHILKLIPHNRAEEEEMIIASILRGEKVINYKTVRKTKTGKEIDVALTVSPMYDPAGRIIGASNIARDISGEVATEAKLVESNLELQRSNMYKDEFIALLGHELKTPLTSLKACLQLAQQIPNRQNEFLDKADHHIERISSMLSELLDVARLQSGRFEIVPTKTNAIGFLKDAVEIVQRAHPSHQIQYYFAVDCVWVNADAARMEQVMINLLTNAVKYSPNSDKVVVRTQLMTEALEITVQDSGLGIPENDLEKIWTRFYRVPSHKKRIPGLGIGLHLCRNIVLAHKGAIWAESVPEKGSVFHVRIPCLEPTKAQGAQ